MKHGKKKILAGTLALLFACSALTGCNSKSEHTPESNAADTATIYEAKLEHYESLIVDLQKALLNEKEENFIAVCEYKLMIAQLEDSIATLSEQVDSMSNLQNPKKDPLFEPQNKNESNSAPTVEILAKNDFSYDIRSDSITITAYTGDSTHVTVPAVINGYPVTAIGEGAFQGSSITTLTLPDSIRSIGWFAFSDCMALSEITVPTSVTDVGYGAFDHCSPSLTIICKKDSYIEAYATSWGIKAEAN